MCRIWIDVWLNQICFWFLHIGSPAGRSHEPGHLPDVELASLADAVDWLPLKVTRYQVIFTPLNLYKICN